MQSTITIEQVERKIKELTKSILTEQKKIDKMKEDRDKWIMKHYRLQTGRSIE